jgi:hypothetical protein
VDEPQEVSGLTYEADDECAKDCVPSSERLESVRIWEFLAIKSLRFHASVESNVGDTDAKPGHETSDGRLRMMSAGRIRKATENTYQVLEVPKNFCGTTALTHEGEESKQ